MCVHKCVYMSACVYMCVCTCMHVGMSVHAHPCVDMHECICVCSCVCMSESVYVHVHACVCLWKSEVNVQSLLSLSTYFLKTGSFTESVAQLCV